VLSLLIEGDCEHHRINEGGDGAVTFNDEATGFQTLDEAIEALQHQPEPWVTIALEHPVEAVAAPQWSAGLGGESSVVDWAGLGFQPSAEGEYVAVGEYRPGFMVEDRAMGFLSSDEHEYGGVVGARRGFMVDDRAHNFQASGSAVYDNGATTRAGFRVDDRAHGFQASSSVVYDSGKATRVGFRVDDRTMGFRPSSGSVLYDSGSARPGVAAAASNLQIHNDLNRDAAEAMLEGSGPGDFLVRAKRDGSLVLSLSTADGGAEHHLVSFSDEGVAINGSRLLVADLPAAIQALRMDNDHTSVPLSDPIEAGGGRPAVPATAEEENDAVASTIEDGNTLLARLRASRRRSVSTYAEERRGIEEGDEDDSELQNTIFRDDRSLVSRISGVSRVSLI
jgi:hypothetical protein